jgi:hypothetical protein
MKMMIQNMMKRLAKVVAGLNIFSSRDFESNVDRLTVIRYGRWATRLYILLFIISFTILTFYTIIRPHTVIETFDEPSFNFYQNLYRMYGNELKCSCSRISSSYNESVAIEPILHSVRTLYH